MNSNVIMSVHFLPDVGGPRFTYATGYSALSHTNDLLDNLDTRPYVGGGGVNIICSILLTMSIYIYYWISLDTIWQLSSFGPQHDTNTNEEEPMFRKSEHMLPRKSGVLG